MTHRTDVSDSALVIRHFSSMLSLTLSAAKNFVWTTLPETSAPGINEALVAIRAIGICGTDFSGYLGKMPFIEFPRILGHELGVEVLAVGEGVTHLQVGDRCSVEPYLNCGTCHACLRGSTNCCETLQVLGVHCDGGMRERMTLPAHKLHPCNALSFEQLALVETLAIGCHAVNRAQITPGDDVLIIGAGPIGLTVLEFARAANAAITVLELNAARRAFVESHYPGVQVVAALPEASAFQIVFDATGNPNSMASTLRHARFTGRIVYVGITKEPVVLDDPLFHRRELTLLASRNAVAADFPRILGMIQSGQIDTRPWVSHRCEFKELPSHMEEWLLPGAGVIKAVVSLGE
jgi:2-desacetyl-2-hydroxyethyl bacteriochlorophyllide A dehydrogenase